MYGICRNIEFTWPDLVIVMIDHVLYNCRTWFLAETRIFSLPSLLDWLLVHWGVSWRSRQRMKVKIT